MKSFDNVSKIVIVGQGFGGLIATLFLADHPEAAVDGLCLVSPFFSVNPTWLEKIATPATNWLGGFDPEFSCVNFSRRYHETLNADCRGEWEWDLNKKPIDGFPLNAGWLQVVSGAQERVGYGMHLDIPVLVLLSKGSFTPKNEYADEHKRFDIIMNTDIARDHALKLGPHVQVKFFEGGLHDILASKLDVRLMAYQTIFAYFWRITVPDTEEVEPLENENDDGSGFDTEENEEVEEQIVCKGGD